MVRDSGMSGNPLDQRGLDSACWSRAIAQSLKVPWFRRMVVTHPESASEGRLLDALVGHASVGSK